MTSNANMIGYEISSCAGTIQLLKGMIKALYNSAKSIMQSHASVTGASGNIYEERKWHLFFLISLSRLYVFIFF